MPEVDAPTLKGPLPGGSPGAAVTLRPLSTGEIGSPPAWLHREPGKTGKLRGTMVGLSKSDLIWTPCPIFLVEHPTAGHVLIDTGVPAAVAHDVKAAFGRLGAAIYNFRAKPEQPLPARLRQLQINAASIRTVLMTHLHLDHAGSLGELPAATILVSKPERESAHAGRAFARGYVRRQYDQAYDFRLVDYDNDAINSFAAFGRSFDVFGDGSITLVSTPGHTAGHQSVVLRLKSREVLLCGDAAYTRRTLEEGALPLLMDDEHNFRRSLREIRAYAQMTPSALVVPGHDMDAFERLEPLYD